MVIKCADFKPEEILRNPPIVKNRRGNPGGKKRKYIALITAFDIETSYLPEIDQSIMYIWQWQIGPDHTVIGRTWEELLDTMSRIRAVMPANHWLVVYVHNLSYEFQFLKGIYTFYPEDVFAIASRKVLKCDMFKCFELRCSYKLTNMSLDQFTRRMGVEHAKLHDFDYTKIRYPWTELSEDELAYCVHDVKGLCEAIRVLMDRDGDNLKTIPLTSTGYVRRNAKAAMRAGNLHHSFVGSILPDLDLFIALREAFRGGNTHANRYIAGDIVENVHSADRSSSYPAVMCNCEFPMSVFVPVAKSDLNVPYIIRCMTIRHKALLMRIRIKNLRLRDEFWGCPYIGSDKCRNIVGASYVLDTTFIRPVDTGRILAAESLDITVTDIDFRIIMEEYTGEVFILQAWYSSYKPLPRPLVDEVIKYYKDKTELKGVKGQELYYDKSKALLNSLYGMMAQSPLKPEIIFQQVGEWPDELTDLPREEYIARCAAILEKYNRKAFLAYQWGVWVTAHARAALEEGIRIVENTPGAHFVYCDTDSVKYIGSVDWTAYNEARKAECLTSGAWAVDPAGITHYMGVFETEDNPDTGYAYYQFKTLGAKKYAYTEIRAGPTHCTIAGVNKDLGGKELDAHGGLAAFDDGFVFRDAGGTQAIYNDSPGIQWIERDGHRLHITSNIAIVPSEYTLGITGEYERIIKYSKNYLLNPYII